MSVLEDKVSQRGGAGASARGVAGARAVPTKLLIMFPMMLKLRLPAGRKTGAYNGRDPGLSGTCKDAKHALPLSACRCSVRQRKMPLLWRERNEELSHGARIE